MKLSKKEEAILNRLIVVSESIYNIKNELKELEKNNKVYTLEWDNKINELKTTISLENSLYNILTFKEINHISDYLLEECEYDRLDIHLQNILNLNKTNIIKTRVFEKLDIYFEDYKAKNPANLADRLYQDDYKMLKVVKKDYLNTILTILNEYLNNNEYQSIKDYLLSIKYALSMFLEVEDDLIQDNFIIGDLYWLSDAYAKKSNHHLSYQSFFDKISSSTFQVITDNCLNETKYEQCEFLQVLTRSYLLFTRNEVAKEQSIKIFQDVLDKITPSNLIYHFNKADYIIASAIKYMDVDKELVNIVSLGI